MATFFGDMFNTLNGGLLQNALNGGAVFGDWSSTLTTAASTNAIYVGQLQPQYTPPIQQAAPPPLPVIEDECMWLRRRVAEVCWA